MILSNKGFDVDIRVLVYDDDSNTNKIKRKWLRLRMEIYKNDNNDCFTLAISVFIPLLLIFDLGLHCDLGNMLFHLLLRSKFRVPAWFAGLGFWVGGVVADD